MVSSFHTVQCVEIAVTVALGCLVAYAGCLFHISFCCRSGFKIRTPVPCSFFFFYFHHFLCYLTWNSRQGAGESTKTFIKYALCNLSSCERC